MSRFRPPARADLADSHFGHPAFAALGASRDLLSGPWPAPDALNARFGRRRHLHAEVDLHFVAQTPELQRDGLHYETRIKTLGAIATRAENWHDLFNALSWMHCFELKCAVNAAYVRELAVAAPRMRTRAQCALTHFDEAGALVLVRDPGLLAAWDAHAWEVVFGTRRAQWGVDAEVLLFGHALLEFQLVPAATPVAKCLVLSAAPDLANAARAVAADIAAGRALRDPQELRPLPLAGLPGWHPAGADPAFLREGPCFRPRRAGRDYPPPRSLGASLSPATA